MAEAKPQPSLLITLTGKAEATLTKAADRETQEERDEQ